MADAPLWHETFSGALAAFVGAAGADGVYMWERGGWTFHPANSRRWDAAHQEVFRNGRSMPLASGDFAARGIPAPPDAPPAGTRPAVWAEQFEAEMRADEAPPGVLPRLAAANGLATFWLVLYEDLYETRLGDGKYLYPAAAFWSESEARSWMAAAPTPTGAEGGYRLTLKAVPACLANGRIKAELGVGPYEHYTVRDMLRRLDKPVRFEGGSLRG